MYYRRSKRLQGGFVGISESFQRISEAFWEIWEGLESIRGGFERASATVFKYILDHCSQFQAVKSSHEPTI